MENFNFEHEPKNEKLNDSQGMSEDEIRDWLEGNDEDYKSDHEKELSKRLDPSHKWTPLPYEDLVNIDDGTKFEILTRIVNIEKIIKNSELAMSNIYSTNSEVEYEKVNYYLGHEYSNWDEYDLELEKKRLLSFVSIDNSTALEAYNSLKSKFPEDTEKGMFVPEETEKIELESPEEGYNFFLESLSEIQNNMSVIGDSIGGTDSSNCRDFHSIFNKIPNLTKVKNLKDLLHLKISNMASERSVDKIDDLVKASDILDDYFNDIEDLEQKLPELREKFIEIEEQLKQEEWEAVKKDYTIIYPAKKNNEFIKEMSARYTQLSAKALFVTLLFIAK